eukprot:Amastigsp_a535947_10.p3 type:complete len:134 gc:universal Amastigsp_a535947_10:95-496(+)
MIIRTTSSNGTATLMLFLTETSTNLAFHAAACAAASSRDTRRSASRSILFPTSTEQIVAVSLTRQIRSWMSTHVWYVSGSLMPYTSKNPCPIRMYKSRIAVNCEEPAVSRISSTHCVPSISVCFLCESSTVGS